MAPTSAPSSRPATKRTPPFEGAVGLSLSGGGFRAAGFHLGVLTTFQRAGLLERTRVLSSVSGGTLVALRTMLGLARGESFDEIHVALQRFLSSGDLITRALSRAASERTTATRALATELDESLFLAKNDTPSTMRTIFEARISIEEGSFNAAEARSGHPFRFTFSRGPHARVGHQGAYLPRKVAENVRLGDVAAACCAFPGSLEPLVVPTDFTWPDPETAQDAREGLLGSSVGLIDGGVHDNQGIDPMLLAAQRLDENLGLLVVSDADRAIDAPEPRKVPERQRFGGLRVWHLDLFSVLFGLMALASIGLLATKAQLEREIHDFRWTSDGIAFGVPAAFCVISLVALLYARRRVTRAVAPLLPHLDKGARRAVRRMRVTDLVESLQTRFRTLEAVAIAAFPRRLRGLVYRGAWSNRDLVDRRVAVQIGSLSAERVALVDGLSTPSTSLLEASTRTSTTAKALRLASTDELEDLMRTGEATAVLRLVEALEVQFGSVRETWPPAARELDQALRADWDALNASERALRPR